MSPPAWRKFRRGGHNWSLWAPVLGVQGSRHVLSSGVVEAVGVIAARPLTVSVVDELRHVLGQAKAGKNRGAGRGSARAGFALLAPALEVEES